MGFDAANEVRVDMISAGIIEPFKVKLAYLPLLTTNILQVVRTALTDTAEVSSLLSTAITEIPEAGGAGGKLRTSP